MSKKEENKRCIEVKFNSEKEKIFIFLKPNTTIELYTQLINLFEVANRNKIYLLPTDFVDSVKVVKDVKDKKYNRWIRFLKKDIAKGCGTTKKELFGKEKKEEYPAMDSPKISLKEKMFPSRHYPKNDLFGKRE